MTAEKILLVDDEEGIRKVLGISLTDIGYDVRTAENGDNALRIFKEFQPPVVLTDIKMPGMDGIELLHKIKTEKPETEVIMITGHGDMNLAIKSLKYEATDFISKPINLDVLEIALKRAHEKISMRRQIKEYTSNLENLVLEKSAKIVELERQAAVGQTVEGLTSAIRNIAGDLDDGITYSHEMPCFVSIHDRDLKVVAANQLYTRQLGHHIGDDCWKIYCGESGRPETCPTAATIQSGTGLRRKATIRYSNGAEAAVVVHTAPIKNRDGRLDLVVEISVDITEVKRLQEELRTTQQRYQQLFDEAPCYISVQDKDFKITAANRRFKEDFGHDTGTFCFEVYQHQSQPCPDCPVRQTFADGQSHQAEMMVTSKTGQKYNVLVWTAPIRNNLGDVTQVMEMSTNITQIRQLQDHLSSLGLLIGSVSHGIKGLLTGLDGGMYLLNSGFAKADQAQLAEGWDIVKLMVGRIRSMVQDILYYAKERELNWEQIDVLSFVKDIAMTFGPKIQNQGINFICDFDETVGKFEVDPGIIRSALINFLENALEACLEDSSKPVHKISFSVRHDSTHIVFDVIDNGIGMDEATKKNIFTLFFSSKGNRGTGLGLFISNKIIRQHGGTIEVNTGQSEGTRMGIKIPKIFPAALKKNGGPGGATA